MENFNELVEIENDFDGGIVKRENGKYFILVNGEWQASTQEAVRSLINAEMGYIPTDTNIPSKPSVATVKAACDKYPQMGEQ